MKQTNKQVSRTSFNTKRDNSPQKAGSILRFLPAVLWMGVIFYLSSRTGEQLQPLIPWVQKLLPFVQSFNFGHFIAYFILAATLDFGFGKRGDRLHIKLYIIALCGLYGVTDEWHQMYVDGRTPELLDIRNDIIGGALWILFSSIPPLRRIWYKLTWVR